MAITTMFFEKQISPVDGGWTTWGDWNTCSVTCGSGTQKRSRSCTNPTAAHGGKTCVSPREMIQKCNNYVLCPGKRLQD